MESRRYRFRLYRAQIHVSSSVPSKKLEHQRPGERRVPAADIDRAAVERFHKAVKAARSKGRIVHGGVELTDAILGKGNFVAQTIVAELPPDHWIDKEELFLPFLSVQACASLEEGSLGGNRNVYGLCAGLHSESLKEIEGFLASVEASVLYVNRKPFAIPRNMREQSLTIIRD